MTQTLEKIAIIGGSLILLVIGVIFISQLIIQNIQIG